MLTGANKIAPAAMQDPSGSDTTSNDGSLDWATLAALIHPTKVLIVEAMCWIDRPLSASELAKVFDGRPGTSAISYHLGSLVACGILELFRKEQVRGALKKSYVFTPAAKRSRS